MSDRHEDFLKKEIGLIDRHMEDQSEENKKNMRVRKIALQQCLDEYQKVRKGILEDAKENVRKLMDDRFRKKLQEIGRKIADEQY